MNDIRLELRDRRETVLAVRLDGDVLKLDTGNAVSVIDADAREHLIDQLQTRNGKYDAGVSWNGGRDNMLFRFPLGLLVFALARDNGTALRVFEFSPAQLHELIAALQDMPTAVVAREKRDRLASLARRRDELQRLMDELEGEDS